MDDSSLPAEFLYSRPKDPAAGTSGAPNYSREILPHVSSVNGRYGLVSYSYLSADQAINDSRANAYRMRNDCGIMESLHARQRAVALQNWSIEPEDSSSFEQQQLVRCMTDILQETPRFAEMRRCLLESLWYGRYMTLGEFENKRIGGINRICCKKWSPRNGDKLKFRFDDGTLKHVDGQVGIRVSTAYSAPRNYMDPNTGEVIQKIQPTEEGLVYWLDKWERRQAVVHKHMIEDAPFFEPKLAGRINGVGIRDYIYWDWYAMIECLQRVVEYLDRAAFGVEIWPYQAGSPAQKEATEKAAEEAMGGGRTIILAPIQPGEDQELFVPRLVEPGLGGINTTIDMIRTYWGHKIKRFILGQVLSSEAEATGLGSGVADAHLATLADIVQYDSVNLEETITTDFLRPLQMWNFPDSAGIRLQFRISTEEPDSDRRLASMKMAWDMGMKIRADEVADTIGVSMPDADDEVLQNPAFMQAGEAAMGMPGADPSMPMQGMPAPGQPAQAPIDLGQVIEQNSANGAAMSRAFKNRVETYL